MGCMGNGPQESITRKFLRRAGACWNRILRTLESIAAASASPLTTASMEFRWDPEQNTLSKKLSSAPDSASLFRRLY